MEVLYSLNLFDNFYHPMGDFSRRRIDVIFFYFHQKKALTFHTNCIHSKETICRKTSMSVRRETILPAFFTRETTFVTFCLLYLVRAKSLLLG